MLTAGREQPVPISLLGVHLESPCSLMNLAAGSSSHPGQVS